MTAKQLRDILTQLENDGNNLAEIEVNFRHDYDSDVVRINYVNEDLYDEGTNNKLVSICLMYEEESN